jgi:hypothetical protein
MNKDKFQDKYQEIFQEIKEEKMNWNFDDFLAKTEEKPQDAKIVPLHKKSSKQWMYIAASMVLIFGLVLFFNNDKTTSPNDTIASAIEKQKNNGEFAQVYPETDNISVTLDSAKTTEKNAEKLTEKEDVVEKILPKKGRLKKTFRPRYVKLETQKNLEKTKTQEYNPNYVIINGHKIESEKEAIDVTKYSFHILSEKVSQTVASTEKNINTDY